ncbi:MAG: sigma-54-dependent Fis family transcriptional regulator [Bacteroidetes bacterium]|nr:sigma-54-dependent Fis family transcriptional regulator [Bacteroidota bacterium]
MNKSQSKSIDLERQVFHLQTLYEIAHSLNNCRTSAQIYKEVLSILIGTLGVEYGVSLHFSKAWNVVAERGFEKEISLDLEKILLKSTFDSKSSAMKKKLISDFITKQKDGELSDEHSFWLEFSGRDKVVGGLFLGRKLSRDMYSETDYELLEAVASHSTTALENLQLYEDLKDAQERLQLENIALREEVLREYEGGRIIGQSESILKILQQAKNVAKSPTNVLIYGETGTGKELLAKTIHYQSPRKDNSFVAVNCTAIPENLVESELFGIESGVATGVKKHIGYFEQADGGTLFIDEIGDMPLSSQAKILRALQERSFRRVGGNKEIAVDVRVVVATNKNLEHEMREGNFREDLFFRLSVLELHLPPLRNRRDDIPLLLNHFVKKIEEKLDTKIKGFSKGALRLLAEYDWQGNVRELENEVERAIALAGEGAVIQREDLSPKIYEKSSNIELPNALNADTLRGAVDQLESHLIQEALEKYHWNKSEVARQLGISRLGLQKKLDRLGIRRSINDFQR